MRKVMTMVVGVAVLCATTAFAQTGGTPATTTGATPEARNRPGRPEGMEIVHHAIREAEHNPAVLPLVTQALTDRTTLLNSEINRVAQLQALVTAIQGGDKSAIQSAMAAVKTASETVQANEKTFAADCKAIMEQFPHEGGRGHRGGGATPATTPN